MVQMDIQYLNKDNTYIMLINKIKNMIKKEYQQGISYEKGQFVAKFFTVLIIF